MQAHERSNDHSNLHLEPEFHPYRGSHNILVKKEAQLSEIMLGLWLICAIFFGATVPEPCSALDTFLPDPGIELKANQVLKLVHEEGERFDLFPVEEAAFVTLETHPSRGTPIM